MINILLNTALYPGVLLLFFFSFVPLTFAHPGNTDSSGCHTCRTNCANWGLSSGAYHCHNNKGVPQPSTPIRSHYGNPGTTEVWPAYFGLSGNSSRSMSYEEVTNLQRKLATDPTLYPEGLVTGHYGNLTQAAIKRFQVRHGIINYGTPETTGYGSFGPKTRIKFNEIYGSGS